MSFKDELSSHLKVLNYPEPKVAWLVKSVVAHLKQAFCLTFPYCLSTSVKSQSLNTVKKIFDVRNFSRNTKVFLKSDYYGTKES